MVGPAWTLFYDVYFTFIFGLCMKISHKFRGMGYATVQRTRDSAGQVIEEFYLDAAGNPVERYGDYCGIAYEYNDGDSYIDHS